MMDEEDTRPYVALTEDNPMECLGCGTHLNGHLSPSSHPTPRVGDISICVYCRVILVFAEDTFRWPTDEEFTEFMGNPQMQQAIHAIERLHREKGVPK